MQESKFYIHYIYAYEYELQICYFNLLLILKTKTFFDRFLRRENDISYGVKNHNTDLMWFVYGYPKPKITYYFDDLMIQPGGRFDFSYTRNGQATLFINE